MRSLGGHVECVPDLDPGPVGLESTVDGVAFESRSATAKGDDGRECFGGVVGGGNANAFGHGINLG